MGETESTESRLDQSWQAPHFSNGISEYQSGNPSAMGKVETAKESELMEAWLPVSVSRESIIELHTFPTILRTCFALRRA